AVHSAKDLPGQLPEGLIISAILKREDPRDVLLATSHEVHLENVSKPIRIGTSSLRRTAFLHYYCPNVEVRNLRGNLDTRIQKLEAGEYDGILLAYAGVKRLGLEKYTVQKLSPETFTPAAGQGAIAITCLSNRQDIIYQSTNLSHRTTQLEVESERAFLRTMEGGCNLPIFAFARVFGETIQLIAGIATVDGSNLIRHQIEGSVEQATTIGEQMAIKILEIGGAIRNGIQN
ncbi:MAG: hydroxymethylbilane synthase, partial [Bacteroidia bacterium]|nr:hydroxymethylbilane synthase [Bacteroidia bacterium]